jgi:hypothetical protein
MRAMNRPFRYRKEKYLARNGIHIPESPTQTILWEIKEKFGIFG